MNKNRIQPPLIKVYNHAVPIVCKQFQVSKEDLFSRRRSNQQALAARVALYNLLFFHSAGSLVEVAEICLRKDYTTVIKGIQTSEQWATSAPAFEEALNESRKQLNAALTVSLS